MDLVPLPPVSLRTAFREISMTATLKDSLIWVIKIGAVLLFLAGCLNLELFPVALAY